MQRRVLSVLAVGGALAATLAACSSAGSSAGSSASPASDQQHQADLYGIEQIEVNWHKASSTKDLDLMMSQWADNATFTIGTQTYTGKDQIRNFFVSTAAPFKAGNTWVSDTPAYKIVATVDGDKGTLYFECHYVDVDPNHVTAPNDTYKKLMSVVGANQAVARINGKWVITSSISASPILEP